MDEIVRAPKPPDVEDEWEAKYAAVFSDVVRGQIEATGVRLEYCDPDTTYEEDVRAYARAVRERADELRAEYGVQYVLCPISVA